MSEELNSCPPIPCGKNESEELPDCAPEKVVNVPPTTSDEISMDKTKTDTNTPASLEPQIFAETSAAAGADMPLIQSMDDSNPVEENITETAVMAVTDNVEGKVESDNKYSTLAVCDNVEVEEGDEVAELETELETHSVPSVEIAEKNRATPEKSLATTVDESVEEVYHPSEVGAGTTKLVDNESIAIESPVNENDKPISVLDESQDTAVKIQAAENETVKSIIGEPEEIAANVSTSALEKDVSAMDVPADTEAEIPIFETEKDNSIKYHSEDSLAKIPIPESEGDISTMDASPDTAANIQTPANERDKSALDVTADTADKMQTSANEQDSTTIDHFEETAAIMPSSPHEMDVSEETVAKMPIPVNEKDNSQVDHFEDTAVIAANEKDNSTTDSSNTATKVPISESEKNKSIIEDPGDSAATIPFQDLKLGPATDDTNEEAVLLESTVDDIMETESLQNQETTLQDVQNEDAQKAPPTLLDAETPSPHVEEIETAVDTHKEAISIEEHENDTIVKYIVSENKQTEDDSSNVFAKENTIPEPDDAVMDSKQLEATENMPEESLEAMDTCDSQESTNLVIDETPEVNKSLDATEMPSNDDKIEQMDVSDVSKPTEDNSENQDGKDDDVIPIEQPPMQIIEIDDDDDDEPPPVKNCPSNETKEQGEKYDKVDKGIVQDATGNTDATINKEADSANEELLAVVKEKGMDEVLEEDNSNKENQNDDTTDEIFYNKECINYECSHKHKQFFRVPQFAFSYFKVNKKKFKMQYICADCYDKALEMFEEYCGLINAKQPLLMENIPSGRQEFVEIIDSSDEEDSGATAKIIEPSKSAFSRNDLSLIERELHNTIKSVLERVEIQNQLTWSKTILSERLNRLEKETNFVDSELRSLQRKADKMHEGLYMCPKIKIRQLQPLDLNSGKIMSFESQQAEVQPIPPVGEIERPPIQTNGTYYAVKNNAIASWVPCKVVDQVEGGSTAQKNVKYYRIKYIKSQYQMVKSVPAKYMAYYEPPTVRLPIGTRVIAYFDATSLARGREKMNVQSAFYPGIIAEPLKPNNKFRYLIFYDDGYTQYVYHKDVRLVCHVSENVWEDVHPASRDFIQKYLTQYSINRPMVQTQKGQSMNTESNGYWLHARVVDIDCSLVLMQFEGSKSHTEWIYRGSLRLGPVFKEYQKTLQKNSTVPVSRLPRRTEPFIRYTEDEESSSQQQQSSEKATESNRAVARKSFGRPESIMNASQPSASLQREHAAHVQPVKHLNNSTIYLEDENKPKGKVVYYTAKRNLPPRKYTHHICKPGCLFETSHNLSAYSPLSKPLLSGWERFIIKQKIKKVVTYRAPCGKILRNMKELHHYLRVTQNVLNVDNFDFSPDTNCLAEYVIESAIVQKRDISCGQEKMAIPLVNYYDSTLPPECKYSAKVIPTEGVHINKDPEFFAGCDCDDDCADKSKCSCWQLTIAGAKYGNPNTPMEEVGYQYKRLLEHVPTGIYECNPRCKCKQNCLNRVVQQSLQLKLQVFKTSNRGWGLRCINDVPRGTFVCVYAGHLLTEAKANEGGQDAGDEYFAELDYIEVAEQIKEGYESEVELPELDEEDSYQPEIDDDDFTPSKSFLTRAKRQSATKSTRPGNQEDDSQERQVINFNPNADMNEDSVRESSIRKLYGKDEACYVMDAKISGNLGRYFNHSCAPNMFVQNVFVDTHDLRFPWVAFFASCNIRAGTELTWNYNYEVGVVPGKVLYCQCGAPTCRLRLL